MPRSKTTAARVWAKIAGVMAVASLAAGCQSVSDDPTVPAFADLAASVHGGLDAARLGEDEAFRTQAIREALAGGEIGEHGCLHSVGQTTFTDCGVSMTVGGQPVDVGEVGPRVAELAAKLDRYGQGLKGLAAAQDIADQKTALQKLGSSAGELATAAGIPGVAEVANLAAELVAQARLQQRRAVLAKITRGMDPAIGPIARKIQSDLVELRKNVLEGRIQRVSELSVRLRTSGGLDMDRRAAIAEDLFDAAAAERAAASLSVDVSETLPQAHAKMVASLEHPGSDVAAAIAEFTVVRTDVEKVAAALGPVKK